MKTKIILLLLCFTSSVMAQQLRTGSFEQDAMDIDATVHKVYDANNKPCALVKVLLVEPTAEFNGDVVKTKHEENEYWAYMTEGATYIKIKTKNYLPYEYKFPFALQSGQTYILTVIKEDKIYLKKNSFYFGGSGTIGSFSGATGHVGGTLSNVDVHLSYTFGLAKKGPVNFYDPNDGSFLSKNEYSLNSFTAKLGYQFTLASHFGIVPQVGYSYQSLTCHTLEGVDGKGGGTSSSCAVVGAKFLYSPLKHFCLFVSPEYDFAINKDKMFDVVAQAAGFSAGGFYCHIGVLANF